MWAGGPEFRNEQTYHPIDPPDPIEAIKFRMSQQKLTRKQLEPMIGTRTRVAEVLNRRRSLSISMIRRLHATLGIPAEVLIRPSRAATGGKRPDGSLAAIHRSWELATTRGITCF
jgi:transcriptional regulator with XRE-family HTH domain